MPTNPFDITSPQAGSQIGVARGTSPGQIHPDLAGKSNEELAKMDRLQFNRSVTRNNPIAGAVGAIGLTGADAVKSIPGATSAIGGILGALGGSDSVVKEFTETNEHTSKPSLDQAMSNLTGFGQGLGDFARDKMASAQDTLSSVMGKKVQANKAELTKAEEDSKVAKDANDPVERKRALMKALNGNTPGEEGGMAGILAALGQ